MELEMGTAAGQRGPAAESRAKPQGVRAAVLFSSKAEVLSEKRVQ